MPINATYEYEQAQKKFDDAQTVSEKLRALQEMLSKAPSHKGSEKLRKELKTKISRYKDLVDKEKKTKKGSSFFSIRKEGAARISIIGLTNSGKSTLLSKLTNAKPLISEKEFATKLPEIGVMDYKGIKIQMIEIPAITPNYNKREHGLFFLSLIRESDLIVAVLKSKSDLETIKKELKNNDIEKRLLLYQNDDIEEFRNDIWKSLNLIKVYTKQPGKEKDYPPIALKKSSKIKNLAENIHKDFIRKFRFARVWGDSIKHQGARVGLDHILEDEDIVEVHLE